MVELDARFSPHQGGSGDRVNARNRFAARVFAFSEGSASVVHVERAREDRTDINQQWGEVERGSKAAPTLSADDREQQARVRKLGRRRREEWWRQADTAPSIPVANERDVPATQETERFSV